MDLLPSPVKYRIAPKFNLCLFIFFVAPLRDLRGMLFYPTDYFN